ncbi:hypothetical protein F7U66_11080 [Vibrio parahaemolyticus]|nr:hypothetical protein [Vibrio parahaemolyticus]
MKDTNHLMMADVFSLPVYIDETWLCIYSGKKQVFKPNFNFEAEWELETKAAVIAINNHDRLSNENAELKDAIKTMLNSSEILSSEIHKLLPVKLIKSIVED